MTDFKDVSSNKSFFYLLSKLHLDDSDLLERWPTDPGQPIYCMGHRLRNTSVYILFLIISAKSSEEKETKRKKCY
jgi:hypothetical protein